MKRYLLLFVSVALSTVALAQSKPSVGVKAGVTYAGLQGDAVNSLQSLMDFSNGAITTGSKPGVFAGVNVSLPIAENVSIEPGVYYAQKGYEMRGSFSVKGAEFLSANAKAQLNTSYIDVPVLAKVNVSGLQIFGGPQVSYLADAKLRATAGALGFNVLNQTYDAKSQFNEWDVALTGGLGYQFANGLSVSAAYDHGLSKIDKAQNLDSYNRVFKVGVGFSF
jgi:hypothetical protein